MLYFFILLGGLLCSNVNAQNSSGYADSLILATQDDVHDTVKIFTYMKLYEYYLPYNKLKAQQYESKMYDIASEYNRIEKFKCNADLIKVMNFKNAGNIDSAIVCLNKSIPYVLSQNAYKTLKDCYLLLAWLYRIDNNIDSSLNVSHKGVELSEQTGDSVSLVKFYLQIGSAYKHMYNYYNSQEYLHKAYHISNFLNNEMQLAEISAELGSIHKYLYQYEEAADHYRTSCYYFKSRNKYKYISTCILLSQAFNGLTHSNVSYYDSAFYYLSEVSGYEHPLKFEDKFNYYKSMFSYYSNRNDMVNAGFCIDSLDVMINNDSDEIYKSGLLQSKVSYHYLAKDYNNALQYLEQLEPYISNYRVASFYYSMHQYVYAAIGNYDKAYEYQSLRYNIHDSIVSYSRKRSEQELRENIRLQELVIQEGKEKHQLIEENQKYMSRIIIGSSLFVLIFVAAIFFILFQKYKQNRKDNEELGKRERLAKTLLKELNHRVKNNLQMVSVLLSLQEYNSEKIEVKNALKKARNSIDSISLLHMQLYKNSTHANPDLERYIKDISSYISNSFNLSDKVEFNINVSKVEVKVDMAVHIGIILNELLTNAFKYGVDPESDNNIDVRLKTDSKKLILSVINDKVISGHFDTKHNKSGLELVRAMAHDYSGSVTTDFNGHGKVVVELFYD